MKNAIKSVTNMLGYRIVNTKDLVKNTASSNLDEEKVIKKYIRQYPSINKFCVDIGASDGVEMSNTSHLYNNKWTGLAIECDKDKFYRLAKNFKDLNVDLAKLFVTPDNVVNLFKAFDVPKNFGLLSLDIDGYDFYVLEKVLEEYKPSIICAEINEKIPPPIKFSVKYKNGYFWNSSHFFGQSISMLDGLCTKKGYNLAEVHYNNAFYISSSLLKKRTGPEEGYEEGYKNKKDRKDKFPWNSDFEEIFEMSIDKQKSFINSKFKEYKGKYVIK